MEHYLQQLNLTELMTKLDSFFPQLTLDTKKMWELILQGELKQVFWMICESLAYTLTGQAAGMKNLMSSILILGILSVLVTSFLTGFENHQTAQVGYAVFYLLLLAVLFRIFFVCMQAAEEFLVLLGQFCRLTFPALCLSLSAAAGSLTAAGYWVAEAQRRFTEIGGTPEGLGVDYLNFVGTPKYQSIWLEPLRLVLCFSNHLIR